MLILVEQHHLTFSYSKREKTNQLLPFYIRKQKEAQFSLCLLPIEQLWRFSWKMVAVGIKYYSFVQLSKVDFFSQCSNIIVLTFFCQINSKSLNFFWPLFGRYYITKRTRRILQIQQYMQPFWWLKSLVVIISYCLLSFQVILCQ